MNLKSMFTKTDNERRGVAPIIATLLMVAIAVVGGILIFVFAQGFFSGTSDLEVGGNEALQLTGYDTRDIASLKFHNGTLTAVAVNGAADGKLDATGDAFALYLRNAGTKPVTITAIECNSITHGTFSATVTYGTTAPAATAFALETVPSSTGNAASDADAEIAGGEQGTLIIRYGGTATTDDLQNGRNMNCKVYTQGGSEFSIPVAIGKRET